MIFSSRSRRAAFLISAAAIAISFAAGGLLIPLAGASPLEGYRAWLGAGFGCRIEASAHPLSRCALLTTLQMMSPLLLTGLSAMVAFRAGLFSLGQAGQMLLGAAAASSIGTALGAPAALHAALALGGGALAGAAWAGVPGALRTWLGIHEVLTTLIFNALAGMLAGRLAAWGRVAETARLAPLAFNTKLNTGLFIALAAALLSYLYLWRSAPGYEQRMAGEAPRFAAYGGVRARRAALRGMLISGALAGLAGAIEVLGTHYRFVSTFSGGDGFDGVAVAVLGHSHPLGVVIAAFLLAGLRLGATNGLQMRADVPRELGGAMIALIVLLVASERLYAETLERARGWLNRGQAGR